MQNWIQWEFNEKMNLKWDDRDSKGNLLQFRKMEKIKTSEEAESATSTLEVVSETEGAAEEHGNDADGSIEANDPLTVEDLETSERNTPSTTSTSICLFAS